MKIPFFFGREIPLYGLLFVVGVGIAFSIAALVKKKRNIDGFDLVGSAVYTLIMAFIGAKLLFLIVSWNDVSMIMSLDQVPLIDRLEAIMAGGFVFYGGFIGGFLGLMIYCLQFKMRPFDFLDIYATVLPLGHAFGRVGCFLAGCCYGVEYDGIFSIAYTWETDGMTPHGVPLFPVQLFEAGCLVLIFVMTMLLLFKTKEKYHLPVFGYLAAYCVVRFVLEFFRGDKARGSVLFLSTSQLISVIIALVTVSYIVWSVWLKDKVMKKKACNFGEAESEKSLGESDSEK